MTSNPPLILRPLRPADEAAVRAAQLEMATSDNFSFALDLGPDDDWAGYLDRLTRMSLGLDLPDDRVPGSLLVAEVDGDIVGRTSIRYRLNDWLFLRGGHVGYGVLPAHRRRGYAGEILRLSLDVLRAFGVDDVLVTCNDDNVGSRTVIESRGGVLDADRPFADHDGVTVRRYRIRPPTTG